MSIHKESVQKKDLLVFRKWGRKSYSLFTTLHKVVKISVLSFTYFLSVPVTSGAAERDTSEVRMQYDLDEVEVSASRVPVLYSQVARVLSVIESREIEQSPAESVQDLLEYVAGMDVRQRGAEGVQADISIRGGTFDQTLILLNGINITDPQTGHHNLNLPVSLSQIERIEILEGPAARVYGPNAFSGAINIVTRQTDGKSLSAKLGGGSFGYFNAGLSGSFKTGKTDHQVSGNRKSSKGYMENTDFGTSGLFYSARRRAQSGKLSVQAGASEKGFGANSFYTPVYPNQFEKTQTLFSSAKWESESKLNLTPAIFWRRHSDKFMLFRDDAPDWYQNHNYHRTDILGANLNSWFLWAAGKTAFGTSVRSENILSNVLGEPMGDSIKVTGEEAFFTHSKNRITTSVFFEHAYYYRKWGITAGIMGNHISDSGLGIGFFPGIDVNYQLTPSLKMVASWNTSLRMPTFTDLYYEGPTNLGNPELKPEESATLEGGVKLNSSIVKGQAIVFYRRGTNLIDWVKMNDEDDLWQSMNHTKLISRGAELNVQYFPREHLGGNWPDKLQVSYFYNNQTKDEGDLISYYVLDNLRQKLVVEGYQTVFRKVSVALKVLYQDREGTFGLYQNGEPAGETPYNPFWLADAKILYQHRPFGISVSVKNLFDRHYFDLGNVTQPGRWIKASVSYNLKFN